LNAGLVHGPEDIPCIKGTWGHRIVDELEPPPGDIIIEKGAFDDFHNSMLDKVLRIRRVEAVVLTGVSTHAGILGTTFGLIDHGYYFLVPRECVSGYDPELEAAAMTLLRPHLVGLAEILARWTAQRRA
jgi:nicotinamidase-related amidase